MAWKDNTGDLHLPDPYMVKVMALFKDCWIFYPRTCIGMAFILLNSANPVVLVAHNSQFF